MGAKTPSTSSAQYTVDGATRTTSWKTNTIPGRSTHEFTDLDDTDTWTITNWHGLIPRTEFKTTSTGACSSSAALSGTTLTVTFQTDANDQTGFLFLEVPTDSAL